MVLVSELLRCPGTGEGFERKNVEKQLAKSDLEIGLEALIKPPPKPKAYRDFSEAEWHVIMPHLRIIMRATHQIKNPPTKR